MKMQFGKYKGQEISDIIKKDYQYAIWVIRKSNSQTKSRREFQSLIDKSKAIKIKDDEN